MTATKAHSDEVPVDWGKLLETQLERWQGGGSHARGIAEYISNCDDSYRRLKKFCGQNIEVEIHSKRGRHIDKLVIRDFAEGMSCNDLENKFFRYFESRSGRERGEQVTGRFGTGGKAYAIMNFESCWITSVKDGLESKAWFKWDSARQRIVRDYNEDGYRNRRVNKPNQTTVELEDSHKVNHELMELVASLDKLARIRHVVKNQKVTVRLCKKTENVQFELKYNEPSNPVKVWEFPAPKDLCNGESEKPVLKLQYFQKPLDGENFIDLSDGISSVADEKVDKFDGRPFSKYFNGSLTLTKLRDSSAVKENRKGLEEGDDLTEAIESFIKECVYKTVSEVEEEQRRKERERRLSASNEKMKELSKFLRKCDLNFKRELKELKKRAVVNPTEESINESKEIEEQPIYRKPIENDLPEMLIRGRWVKSQAPINPGPEPNPNPSPQTPQFIPDEDGSDFAVAVGSQLSKSAEGKKTREGLRVLMSDDPNVPDEERRVFGEFDDPVDDRDMVSKGIVWINANHPTIVERRTKSENDPVFLEMVANYVLMVVAQFHAQKQYDAEPQEEKSDPILLFRQKFFKFQRDLRQDSEISYFAESTLEQTSVNSATVT
ncbi:MAG TPA: ATP-binding protein [Verrucomicrobiae bacterium]|nr:ATP-binding protein [Verrucomicrobiae bacterium]